MLEERVLEITKKAVSIYSPTNTATEKEVEQYLLQELQEMPYFKRNQELCGAYELPEDVWQRSCIYGLVLGKSRRTVIYMGHHDVVDTDVYGSLAEIATQPELLAQELQKADLDEDAEKDLASGQWLFGRGTCDMKGGTAAQLAVLEEYAKNPDSGSMLFLSVPDEEAFSAGMRGCLLLLQKLREHYGLTYELAVNCEPNSRENGLQTVYTGTVGKLLPCVLVQGRSVQIGSYYEGVNPVALLAEIVSRTEGDCSLVDTENGEQTVPPVWNFMRDFKSSYDFSLPRRGAAYCNILTYHRQPAEVLQWLEDKCREATDAAMAKQGSGNSAAVIRYEQLLQKAQERKGFEEFYQKLQQEMARRMQEEKTDFPALTLWAMEQVLDFTECDEPLIIIGFAPPYYPPLSSKRLAQDFVQVESFVQTLLPLKFKSYFMGISDCSYLGAEEAPDSAFGCNAPAWGKLYSFDSKVLAALQIPFLLLGPWGKDLHRRTERVHIGSLCQELPQVMQKLNKFIWEDKK